MGNLGDHAADDIRIIMHHGVVGFGKAKRFGNLAVLFRAAQQAACQGNFYLTVAVLLLIFLGQFKNIRYLKKLC